MIDALAMHLEPFLVWLLRTTWQAGILTGLILFVQKVAGRWLGVRGCYGLWFLVVIRLALPWTPSSGISLYNLLPPTPLQRFKASTVPTDSGPTSAIETPGLAGATARRVSKAAAPGWKSWPSGHPQAARAVVLLSLVWLAGVCLLVGCIGAGYLHLRGIVRRGRPVTDRWILRLLEECRQQVGTHAAVAVIATGEIDSAALFGIVRPRLLLPRAALAGQDREELRHIFLHELGHLRRHDVLTGSLVTVLHVLHWFNPLLGFGFRRMRADRELACDALALSLLPPHEVCAYGRTIVRQIEQLLVSRPRWMLAGLGGDRAQIKRRIAMISGYRRETDRRSFLVVVLLGLLAGIGLTDRRPADPLDPRSDLPTTHQDEHAFIERVYIRNRETGKYLAVEGGEVVCRAGPPGPAGLWEVRFDINLGHGDPVFFYSLATNMYLRSDDQGRLGADRPDPDEDARWFVRSFAQGAWVISEHFKNDYLCLDEQGQVRAVHFGRDALGYWDIDSLWRIKTSASPEGVAKWRREHVPGPD